MSTANYVFIPIWSCPTSTAILIPLFPLWHVLRYMSPWGKCLNSNLWCYWSYNLVSVCIMRPPFGLHSKMEPVTLFEPTTSFHSSGKQLTAADLLTLFIDLISMEGAVAVVVRGCERLIGCGWGVMMTDKTGGLFVLSYTESQESSFCSVSTTFSSTNRILQ